MTIICFTLRADIQVLSRQSGD